MRTELLTFLLAPGIGAGLLTLVLTFNIFRGAWVFLVATVAWFALLSLFHTVPVRSAPPMPVPKRLADDCSPVTAGIGTQLMQACLRGGYEGIAGAVCSPGFSIHFIESCPPELCKTFGMRLGAFQGLAPDAERIAAVCGPFAHH